MFIRLVPGIILFFSILSFPFLIGNRASITPGIDVLLAENLETQQLYQRVGLDSLLDYAAFEQAYLGYKQISPKKKERLSIIDFTKPSTEKRLFVIDLENEELLFHTVVAHGRNSGEQYAREFSNRHGSFQSSLGFFLTANTYYGSNGYSLVIDGLEKGINDQAKARAVVIHGADYCSEDFVNQHGRLGRSYGCPALPHEVNRAVIDEIKGGSLLYIYAEDSGYETKSAWLKNNHPTTSSKSFS
jgi:hypothetical protein